MSKINLFIDCGAPSLYNILSRNSAGKNKKDFTMGTHIQDRHLDDFSYAETKPYYQYRDEYIHFLLSHKKIITTYSNLDVIHNAKLTWRNQKYLESKGLHPIPVWHFGSEHSWLVKYVKEYKHIAMGGLIPNKTSVLVPNLDNIWRKYLTDGEGLPKVKVHGFGTTSFKLMRRYPWYSVDSTSWLKLGTFGKLFLPKITNGVYDYKKNPILLSISTDANIKTKGTQGKHFLTLSKLEQNQYHDYFKSKKTTYKKLASSWEDRGMLNQEYFIDFANTLPKWPWKFKIVSKGFNL